MISDQLVSPAKLEPTYPPDDGPLTEDQIEQIKEHIETHTEVPSETQPTALGGDITAPEEKLADVVEDLPLEQWNKMIEEAEKALDSTLRSDFETSFCFYNRK